MELNLQSEDLSNMMMVGTFFSVCLGWFFYRIVGKYLDTECNIRTTNNMFEKTTLFINQNKDFFYTCSDKYIAAAQNYQRSNLVATTASKALFCLNKYFTQPTSTTASDKTPQNFRKKMRFTSRSKKSTTCPVTGQKCTNTSCANTTCANTTCPVMNQTRCPYAACPVMNQTKCANTSCPVMNQTNDNQMNSLFSKIVDFTPTGSVNFEGLPQMMEILTKIMNNPELFKSVPAKEQAPVDCNAECDKFDKLIKKFSDPKSKSYFDSFENKQFTEEELFNSMNKLATDLGCIETNSEGHTVTNFEKMDNLPCPNQSVADYYMMRQMLETKC